MSMFGFIKGLGIDSVEIDRFSALIKRSPSLLEKIFTLQELDYSRAVPAKSAERFAARFAAKEAFYKAFCAAFPEKIALIKSKRAFNLMEVSHCSSGAPLLKVDWENILREPGWSKNPIIHLSLTHTKTIATAIVLIQV